MNDDLNGALFCIGKRTYRRYKPYYNDISNFFTLSTSKTIQHVSITAPVKTAEVRAALPHRRLYQYGLDVLQAVIEISMSGAAVTKKAATMSRDQCRDFPCE